MKFGTRSHDSKVENGVENHPGIQESNCNISMVANIVQIKAIS